MTYLVLLDDYHLGDPLFPQGLARAFAQAGQGLPPIVLVHGSGELAQQRLEAQGLFPERRGGVLAVETDEERAIVERATRELNRKLVGTLTDAGVPTVGVQGVDRSLLRGDGGAVVAGRVGWLEAMAVQRSVGVVSALVDDPERPGLAREVGAADALLALAAAWPAPPTLVALTATNQPGMGRDGGGAPLMAPEALPPGTLPADVDLDRLVGAGFPVLITSPLGLADGSGPVGSRVTAGSGEGEQA